jgi:hypothetical protein
MKASQWSGARSMKDVPENPDAARDAGARAANEREESFHAWLLVVVWVVGATIATVWWTAPASVWYDWALIWIGAFGLTGVALTLLYGITFLLHGVWWERLRGRDFLLRMRRSPHRASGRARPVGDMLGALVIWGMIAAFVAIVLAGVGKELGLF